MKIRDLPVMSYHGVRNWPPEWVCQQSGPRLRGEVGRLKDAFVDVRNNTRCFLFMEHNGYGYIATIMFDDGLFPPLFAAALKRHLGETIKEIGDLDIADEFRSPSAYRHPS